MQVATSELRANLKRCLDRARAGEEIVVTDRGTPVARIVGIDSATMIERLTAEGVISRPETSERLVATGRPRPRPSRPVSDLVSEMRD